MARRVALLLALLPALAACGTGGDSRGGSAGPLSVEEALERAGEDAVTVRGLLLVDGDGARLCSALAESYPPQCGGPSLLVDGLPAGERGALTEGNGVAWSEQEVTLRGTLDRTPPHGIAADAVLRVR